MIHQFIRKFRQFLKTIHAYLWLGLLTFLVVIVGVPALSAKETPQPSITQQTQDPAILIEQGRQAYQTGRFQQAAQLWDQAFREAQARGHSLNQALSLSYLANAYQQLGQLDLAQQAIVQSLELLKTHQNKALFAQALITQGSLQLSAGQTQAALDTWKQAETLYRELNDLEGILGSQINQAQALQSLGMYRRAQLSLEKINQQLQTQRDPLIKVTGLRSLGIALQVVGNLDRSLSVLQQSLELSQLEGLTEEKANTLLSLGNTARAMQDSEQALNFYQEAASITANPLIKLEAQLNQFSLLVATQQWDAANRLMPEIQPQLNQLVPSRTGIYAQVNFVQSWMQLAETSGANNQSQIAQMLARAVEQAQAIGDSRAQSYALSQLGYLYEQNRQFQEAQTFTEQALGLAQASSADYITARAQEQLGRILKKKGEISRATAAYTEAVNILKSLRSDLVAVNPDVQFSFAESVEPVYRELVSLLLQPNPSQDNLRQAREVIEALQLAELDNFFREACLDAKPKQIDQVDASAAVIYPIILPDRLEVILSLPGQTLLNYTTHLPQPQVEAVLGEFLESLNPFFSSQTRLKVSQEIYDWLIRPAEVDLETAQVKTLVFVLDGLLRNLPMSALYDGQQYLLEKYSVAITPGLQLLEPRSLQAQSFKAFTGGLTEARQGFSALPGVQEEITEISSEVSAKVLLNQDFTSEAVRQLIDEAPFPVVHLATHGQFSSKPEETFILTWNDKIRVKEIETILQSREIGQTKSLELLVLSACQTAAGDKRAALGLAGVAIRSGARSTVATLWSVQDESTAQLMSTFYKQLIQTGNTKAGALRQAQLLLLKESKYTHPFYWAPFVLVGNWL